jgi:hypothetical protein
VGCSPQNHHLLASLVLLALMSSAVASSLVVLAVCLAYAAGIGAIVATAKPQDGVHLAWTGTRWEVQSADGTCVYGLRQRPQLLVMTSILVLMRVDESDSPVRWMWFWGNLYDAEGDLLRKLRVAFFNRRQFSLKLQAPDESASWDPKT